MTATLTNLTLRPLQLSDGRMLPVEGQASDFEVTDHERRLADGGALDIVDTPAPEPEADAPKAKRTRHTAEES